VILNEYLAAGRCKSLQLQSVWRLLHLKGGGFFLLGMKFTQVFASFQDIRFGWIELYLVEIIFFLAMDMSWIRV